MSNICPDCNGTGKVTLTLHMDGQKHESEHDCFTCDGHKTVTDEELEQYHYEQNMWCKCGNHSGRTRYYGDGEHPEVYKHHYRCSDCDGVTQIG